MMKYDKFDLTGKVALCAGGSSGLGYQFARAMASCLLYTSPSPRDA